MAAGGAVTVPSATGASRLRRDTLAYGAALAVDRLLGLLLLPVLTRLLSPGDYGAWSQTGVAAGLLIAGVLYAFPTLIVRHQSAGVGPGDRRRAFRQSGLLCLGLAVLVGLVGLMAPHVLARLAYGDARHHALVPALLMWMLAEAGMEFAIAWWRALGRIGVIAGVMVLRSVLRLGLALPLAAVSGLPLAAWMLFYSLGLALAAALALVFSARAVGRGPEPVQPVRSPALRDQCREATPLVLLSVLTVLGGSLDRYVLAAFLDLDTLARYAAAASLAAVPFMVHSVLGFTLFPVMARHWSAGEVGPAAGLMDQALRVYLFLSLPIALTVTALGPSLLPWLTTASYQVPTPVFGALALSVLALGVQQVLVYALLLAGQSTRVLKLAMLSAIANVLLLLVLVPALGMAGAALAAALANAGLAILTSRAVRSLVDWRFPWRVAAGLLARGLACGLPLWAVLMLGQAGSTLGFTALLLSGALYLALDWRRADSLSRRLMLR